jgi:SAM-dependent methyltransferase
MQLAAIVFLSLSAAAPDDAKPKHPGYETKKNHDPDGIGKFYMGREIAHVMGYQGAGWLERPERAKEEGEPEKLYKALEVKPGMTIADIGAGSGYHTFKLAPLVGDDGKVIAVDIQPQMLAILPERAKKQKLKNIENVAST